MGPARSINFFVLDKHRPPLQGLAAGQARDHAAGFGPVLDDGPEFRPVGVLPALGSSQINDNWRAIDAKASCILNSLSASLVAATENELLAGATLGNVGFRDLTSVSLRRCWKVWIVPIAEPLDVIILAGKVAQNAALDLR